MILRALAILHVLVSGALILLCLVILHGMWFDPRDPHDLRAGLVPVFLGFVSLVGALVLVPSLVGGLATLRGRHWGPTLLGIASIAALILYPFGTILGLFSLFGLYATRESDSDVRDGAA